MCIKPSYMADVAVRVLTAGTSHIYDTHCYSLVTLETNMPVVAKVAVVLNLILIEPHTLILLCKNYCTTDLIKQF